MRNSRSAAIVASIGLGAIMIAVMAAPAMALPGELDPAFGGDGRVTTNFGGDDGGNAVAIQSDGKIVVAGHAYNHFTGGVTFATT